MTRASVGPSPAATPIRARERRQENRQSLGVVGVLTESSSDNQLQVSVINVSQRGCAFRAPVAYRPGATYTMRIGTGVFRLTSTVRIVTSRERADGSFDIGAKFV